MNKSRNYTTTVSHSKVSYYRPIIVLFSSSEGCPNYTVVYQHLVLWYSFLLTVRICVPTSSTITIIIQSSNIVPLYNHLSTLPRVSMIKCVCVCVFVCVCV